MNYNKHQALEFGDDYLVEVTSATSASYTAGTYSWSAYITRSSDYQRIQIDSGDIAVKTNLATSNADPRTHAEKMGELSGEHPGIPNSKTNDQLFGFRPIQHLAKHE